MISTRILSANRINTTHITGLISLTFPSNTLTITQVITENMIPVAIDYASGIITIAIYAPSVSARSSSKLILAAELTMSIPT